jgi:hypothetical protein
MATTNENNTSIDMYVTNIPQEVMHTYKSTLSTLMGYTNEVYQEKINMFEARKELDTIHEDQVFLKTLDKEKGYAMLKCIEETIYRISDAIGIDRYFARKEMYDEQGDLSRNRLSTTLDALALTIGIYERAIDRAA